MNDVLIRTATPDDIPAIQSVGLLTWPSTYLPFTDPEYVIANINSWWTAEAVQTTVVEETTFVATADSEVVGTLTLGEFEDEPVTWKIYVLPNMQGRGGGCCTDERSVQRCWIRSGRTRRIYQGQRSCP